MNAFVNFFKNDWYFAIPMTVMSLVAFALVAWRFLLNVSAKTDMDSFMPDLQDAIKKHGVAGALTLCREEKGLIPRFLFVAGLEAAGQGAAAMRRSMASAIELEINPRLNYLLAMILAIAKIATMVGLLGTVVSMVQTFSAIGDTKGGAAATKNVTDQSEKIGLALCATAMGLVTAIPLVFCHVLFKDWNHRFELRMKAAAQKLIMLVQNKGNLPNAPPEKAAVPVAAKR